MENFSTLGYMNIVFKNKANYLPPHQSGNSITNYPVRKIKGKFIEVEIFKLIEIQQTNQININKSQDHI